MELGGRAAPGRIRACRREGGAGGARRWFPRGARRRSERGLGGAQRGAWRSSSQACSWVPSGRRRTEVGGRDQGGVLWWRGGGGSVGIEVGRLDPAEGRRRRRAPVVGRRAAGRGRSRGGGQGPLAGRREADGRRARDGRRPEMEEAREMVGSVGWAGGP